MSTFVKPFLLCGAPATSCTAVCTPLDSKNFANQSHGPPRHGNRGVLLRFSMIDAYYEFSCLTAPEQEAASLPVGHHKMI